MRSRHLPPLLVAVALAAPPALPQEDDLLCARCSTSGRVEVEIEDRWEDEHDEDVLFCSEFIREHDTRGIPWEPCSRCKAPSLQARAEEDFAAEEARLLAWLAERESVDEKSGGEDLVHLETTHFVLAWGIPRIRIEKRSYRAHDAAHLYARRLEALYDRFQELFGIRDEHNIVDKHYLLVFEKEKPHVVAGPIYTGLSGGTILKLSGGDAQNSTISMYWSRNEMPGEPDLWRAIVHSMIHQLTSAYYDMRWFPPGEVGLMPLWLNDSYGWLDAGLAHWFEWDVDGEATTFCFREQDATARWKGPDWRKNVLRAVQSGDAPSFARVITKPTQALTPKEHQFCYSWIDFLIARDAEAMGELLKLAKQEKPAREMLQEAYGISYLTFEAEWGAWVEEAYAPQRRW